MGRGLRPLARCEQLFDVVEQPLPYRRFGDGQPVAAMNRRTPAVGSTWQARHQAQNSARSTRRFPVSQLWTQDCGRRRASPIDLWVMPASSRIERRRGGTCR